MSAWNCELKGKLEDAGNKEIKKPGFSCQRVCVCVCGVIFAEEKPDSSENGSPKDGQC